MDSPSIVSLCVKCESIVTYRQHALQCEKCTRWQHRLCDTWINHIDYRKPLEREKRKVTPIGNSSKRQHLDNSPVAGSTRLSFSRYLGQADNMVHKRVWLEFSKLKRKM
jgi:hypothetical protein